MANPRIRKLTTRYAFVSALPAANHTHMTEIVAKIGSKKASKWFKKFDDDVSVYIKLYESYMQSVMRLLDNHQPKTVTAKEEIGQKSFCIITSGSWIPLICTSHHR